ncbi:MAG: DUF58 domain-containing protein [Lentisphaerae bacterium]|nr:DUF58 domain-containing protein [Lentisphaerota bacterium]
MLQTAELLKKVRKLEIITSRMVDDVISGAYRSVFKGRGIEFDEVREYTLEDDVRDIDWNVSARLNAPYVKKYIEERELSVLLMVDVSSSMHFGAPGSKISERAVEVAALLGLSAIGNHDRVGLSLFSGQVDKFLPPRGGRHNNLRLIRELVSASEAPLQPHTNIAQALRNACRVLVKRSVIFVISDLLDHSAELATALKLASRRHDVIVLHLFEDAAAMLPSGVKQLYDAENGRFIRLTNHERREFSAVVQQQLARQQELCRRCGAELLAMPCQADIPGTLMKFFRQRSCRRSSRINR